jgi:hypothetical protein
MAADEEEPGAELQQLQQEARDAGAGGGEISEGVWLPPTNQAGDGRTALNEKYGY